MTQQKNRCLPWFGLSLIVGIASAGASPMQTKRPAKPAGVKPAPTAKNTTKKPQSKPTGAELIAALEAKNARRALNLVRAGADPNAVDSRHTQSALGLASGLGDIALVDELLARGARIDVPESDLVSPLCLALAGEHWAVARRLIEKGADVNASGARASDPEKPLILACSAQKIDLVTLLLDRGADPNFVAPDNVSALSVAASNGDLPLIELLVARGAKVEKSPEVLGGAVAGGHEKVIEFLLSRGRSLMEIDEGFSMLHFATASDKPEILSRVLAGGVPLDNANPDGDTPLLLAIANTNVESVRFLLAKKASLTWRNDGFDNAFDIAKKSVDNEAPETKTILDLVTKAGGKASTPNLSRAAATGDLKTINARVAAGDNPNAPDERGGVPLFYALTRLDDDDRKTTVETLLKAGADPNGVSPTKRPLIEIARDKNANQSLLLLLKKAGAKSPGLELTEAVAANDAAEIDRLLAAKVRPEPDALVLAMERDDRALLKKLLDHDADLNTPTRFLPGPIPHWRGDFALHYAAKFCDVEIVRMLLDKGARIDIRKSPDGLTVLFEGATVGLRTPGGPTALHLVGSVDDKQIDTPDLPRPPRAKDETARIDAIVRLLVERGADVRALHGDSGTPLQSLVRTRISRETLAWFLERGAKDELAKPTTNPAISALHRAVETGRTEVITVLLDSGASPNVRKPFTGITPLMTLAVQNFEAEKTLAIARALVDHGARVDLKSRNGETALQLARDAKNAALVSFLKSAAATPKKPDVKKP